MKETNKEGLTFEEWSCAAGVSKFTTTTNEFIPMGESYTYFVDSKLYQRKYRYNYPVTIRKAWTDGVDPTEWRSRLKRDAWMNHNRDMYGRRWRGNT